jgi:hypothetical protein
MTVGRSVAIFRWVCVVGGIAAVLVIPDAAVALNPPEVFYAEGDVSSYEGNVPQSLWQPLAGAAVVTLSPTIGVRLQDSQSSGTAHAFKIEALSVPDGRPSQDPFYWGGGCIFAIGEIGQIGELQQLQYEGPGAYTIRVTAFTDPDSSSTHCASGGVAQTVSFTIDGRPTLRFSAPELLAGGPGRDSHGNEIGLIETLPPLASSQETACALDARIAADGSVSGSRRFDLGESGISQASFPAPGNWTCVARAFAGVRNPPPGDSNPLRATAWSTPVSALFRTDVSMLSLRIADASPPRFALAGKLNRAAAGGVLRLRLTRGRGCPRAVANEVVRSRVRADGSFRLNMRLAVRPSHRGKLDIALWRGEVSYAGNRLVRSDPHFGELFMGRSIGFVPGIGFLRPPAERRLKLFSGGGCTNFA